MRARKIIKETSHEGWEVIAKVGVKSHVNDRVYHYKFYLTATGDNLIKVEYDRTLFNTKEKALKAINGFKNKDNYKMFKEDLNAEISFEISNVKYTIRRYKTGVKMERIRELI